MFYDIRVSRVLVAFHEADMTLMNQHVKKNLTFLLLQPFLGTHPTLGKKKVSTPYPSKRNRMIHVRVEWFRKVKRISRRPWGSPEVGKVERWLEKSCDTGGP